MISSQPILSGKREYHYIYKRGNSFLKTRKSLAKKTARDSMSTPIGN
jgi:hypothetical protein